MDYSRLGDHLLEDDDMEETPFRFHVSDKPAGMSDYKLNVLTASQQHQLNTLKKATVVDDHIYLARHPEVAAIAVLLVEHMLRTKPLHSIFYEVGKYFARSKIDLTLEVHDYLKKKGIYSEETARILGDYTMRPSGLSVNVGKMQRQKTSSEELEELEKTEEKEEEQEEEEGEGEGEGEGEEEEGQEDISPTVSLFARTLVDELFENVMKKAEKDEDGESKQEGEEGEEGNEMKEMKETHTLVAKEGEDDGEPKIAPSVIDETFKPFFSASQLEEEDNSIDDEISLKIT